MKTKINFDINKLVRPNILKLKPYQSAREQMSDKNAILLDANENPFPVEYNRYPDPLQRELKMKIAEQKKTPVENIFLGNGSDEIIDLLIRAFCIPGKDSILINVPTYGMYEVCANMNDVKVIKVELDDEFQIDIPTVLKKSQQAKIIFICSPNNPTANLIQQDLIVDLLENFNRIVVVDEAYIDFANDAGFLSKIDNYPNLVVLQTFSKARAMAGIRLGMAFMNAEIVNILTKIKYPYNISLLNQKAALKALEDDSVSSEIKAILQQRDWLISELQKLKIVEKIWPSDANFLLVQFKNHKQVFDFLKKEGIIVRDRSNEPNCNGCLRITVGKSLENLMLITILKHLDKRISEYDFFEIQKSY
ncbi:MAG: histidinol-phosphate aminotransferase [Bacteroidales bacterium]|nr:histidinol-phosphate aminotransferase [Bacteroidales bacterium]